MNKAEFQRAWEVANSDKDLSDVDDTILDGFGLRDFEPVTVTIEVVAKMLRWQCFYIFGVVDQEALTECRNHFRRKVTVVELAGAGA